MNEQLSTILSQGRWDRASTLLRGLPAVDAADMFMSVPYEQQQALFRKLPTDLAARLTGAFPYYHAYVLLHSRPLDEMNAIVDQMKPGERMHFFDELPEEAWQTLMDELAEARQKKPEADGAAEPAIAPGETTQPAEPIIEARGIEKTFERPDGGQVQVIAPTDLSIEPGMIVALLGPSGSGKSTLLRMLSGLAAAIRRRSALARQAARGVRAQRRHRVPELRAVSLAHRDRECRGAAAGARHGARRAASARPADTGVGGTQRIRERLSQGTLGRHEAARGIRARAGRGARDPVHGRTILRARRADRREPARRTDGAVARQENPDQAAFSW